MKNATTHTLNQQQYADKASAYLTSNVHAQGEEFAKIRALIQENNLKKFAQAMDEVFRVLLSGGKCIIVDILGNSNPTLDNLFKTLETVRDPSHVRDYSLSEWLKFAEYAGFTIEKVEKQTLRLAFKSWVERMQTPNFAVQTLQYLLKKASQTFREYYQVSGDGSFTSDVMVLVLGKKP